MNIVTVRSVDIMKMDVLKENSKFSEICRLPQVSGRCMAYIPRYFFDYNAGVCREFVYGGCEGNANNFESLEACERRCALYLNRVPGNYKFSGKD